MSDPNRDILRILQANEKRLAQTEVKEVPGAIPGFTSFYGTGSFTPTLVGATTPGTFTYTANATIVEWSRIGNQLFFNGRIVITAIAVAPVGTMTVNGWPYAGVSDANMAIAGITPVEWRGIALPANYWSVVLQFNNGSSTAQLARSGTNNAQAPVQGAEIALVAGSFELRFGGGYRVA